MPHNFLVEATTGWLAVATGAATPVVASSGPSWEVLLTAISLITAGLVFLLRLIWKIATERADMSAKQQEMLTHLEVVQTKLDARVTADTKWRAQHELDTQHWRSIYDRRLDKTEIRIMRLETLIDPEGARIEAQKAQDLTPPTGG